MSEMREWFANVYASQGRCWAGGEHETRRSAAFAEIRTRGPRAVPPAIARIHVRLKPEGAPKRYASEAHRHNWERSPDFMRSLNAPHRRDLETEGTLS